VKYPSGFQIPDDDEARLLLRQARQLGINLIDTAPAYGRSEERLGPLLRGQRNEWVIVSKVGEHTTRTLDVYPEAIIADHRYGYIKSILRQGW